MTARFAHARHPAVDLRTTRPAPDILVNGREATRYELEILGRAREAARVAETNALFTGTLLTDSYSG